VPEVRCEKGGVEILQFFDNVLRIYPELTKVRNLD
jgi:hypothetical protein